MNPLRAPYKDEIKSLVVCNPKHLIGTINDALQSVGSIKHYVVYAGTTAKLDPYVDKVATVYSTRIDKYLFMVQTTIHERDYARYDKGNKNVTRGLLTYMLHNGVVDYVARST